MRISFILSSLRLSGGVLVITEYAKRLTDRGHEIHLIVPKGTTDPEVIRELSESVFIHQTTMNTPTISKRNELFQLLRLTWSLARVTPKSDVIIATHTPTTVSALIASHLFNKGKSVWFYQDYLEMFLERPYESWLIKNALRWFNCALVVSKYSISELKQNSTGEVIYVGEGLSHADEFHPISSELLIPRGDRQIILSMGDERPRKGFYDFLEAAALVNINLPNIELWIYSKEHLSISIDIPYKFFYRPTRRELARLYASSDVFVSASWWESFGLPPLEAMACGTPVVMTDSRGVREYANPNVNCLMTPPRDPQSLAKAITKVLTNQTLASGLRQKGPSTAKKISWDDSVNRFEQAIINIY